MSKSELGWHFVGDTLRDGSPVPADGEWLTVEGPLEMCERGLHYSRDPFDALRYAPGETLCRVEVEGFQYKVDKGVAHSRKIIKRIDATELLRGFARQQALSVIHLWDAPDVVVQYLVTGEEKLRGGARDAAWAAARDAAWAAAWDAAWAAARAAARGGARDAAWAAAWDAARAGARDAAWAAARGGARAAARGGAWAAAHQSFNDLVTEAFNEQG